MKVLIHPTYFPSVSHLVALSNASEIVLEKCDNYQKQTYRNRMYIYSPNGKQMLNIPIKHTGTGRQYYKDVRLENDFPWQKEHWKSLEAGYRTSPFFEYYEDEMVHLFEKKQEFLFDFNVKSLEIITDCLQLEPDITFTNSYEEAATNLIDCRYLVDAKKEKQFNFEPYTQVFEERAGYLNNLSTLDLLFNEGTNALTYLEQQTL